MWDSAKKPIKVRSVLQPNGMRHFIVNEETEETHIKLQLQQQQQQQQRKNSNKTVRPTVVADSSETFSQQSTNAQSNGLVGTENNGSNFPENHYNSNRKERMRRESIGTSCPLLVYSSNDSYEDRWGGSSENDGGNFFGVSGSKIHNSKKYKGQHSRHLHQLFPHGTKSSVEITRYPHLRSTTADVLDLVPVKSPVIKKLISGRVNSTDHHHGHHQDNGNSRLGSNQRNNGGGTPSTTLCSRIMTWIDLEVKRNAACKTKSTSGSLSFNSADLSIVNELLIPGDNYDSTNNNASKLSALSSSSPSDSSGGGGGSSSASSSSGESSTNANSSCMSSSSSTCSSSTVSLPKLTPCWRKEGSSNCVQASNKAKKSVRIAEDLPRWGKMKRRLRRKTVSLNELYEDEPLSPYDYRNSSSKKTDYNNSSSSNSNKLLQSRKVYSSSVSDLLDERRNSNLVRAEGGLSLHDEVERGRGGEEEEETAEEKETDSFVVRDERLLSSGKLQVHIFLPQTESASGRGGGGGGGSENTGNLSGRSEDSTS